MQVPYILCGDFNVEPHYPFYKLLSTGTLDAKDIDNLASYDYVNQYPGTTLPDKVSTHAMVHVLGMERPYEPAVKRSFACT